MKLACQENLIPGRDLIEKWQLISALGYEGIELRGHGNFQFRARLPELKAAARAGVIMPTVCVIMDHFIGDDDARKRRDAMDNMKSLLSVIAELGGYGAITPASYGLHSNSLPPFKAPRSRTEDREVLVEALGELAEHAAQEDVYVLLEPLNRYGDYMLNRLEQAVELCKAVGLSALKVVGDFYHMNIEERDLAEAIRETGDYLKHMHLADNNRLQPGLGHIDFAPALRALTDIRFEGYLALECTPSGDPTVALSQTSRYLRSLR